MSRYIDYDAIDYRNDKMHDKSSDFIDGVLYMAQRIEDAPSIDIVRCRDCKHCQYLPENKIYYCYKSFHKILDAKSHYCGFGKERVGV